MSVRLSGVHTICQQTAGSSTMRRQTVQIVSSSDARRMLWNKPTESLYTRVLMDGLLKDFHHNNHRSSMRGLGLRWLD